MCLGAQGAQLGTRFVATVESSAHINFKNAILSSNPGSTMVAMKKYVPVRLFKNKFFDDVKRLEDAGGSKEDLETLLGHGRAKRGMLEGDMAEGEIEIGQIASLVRDIPTVEELVKRLVEEQKKAFTLVVPF
jgi:enoyl-[acyl-carrier protein] reductase II